MGIKSIDELSDAITGYSSLSDAYLYVMQLVDGRYVSRRLAMSALTATLAEAGLGSGSGDSGSGDSGSGDSGSGDSGSGSGSGDSGSGSGSGSTTSSVTITLKAKGDYSGNLDSQTGSYSVKLNPVLVSGYTTDGYYSDENCSIAINISSKTFYNSTVVYVKFTKVQSTVSDYSFSNILIEAKLERQSDTYVFPCNASLVSSSPKKVYVDGAQQSSSPISIAAGSTVTVDNIVNYGYVSNFVFGDVTLLNSTGCTSKLISKTIPLTELSLAKLQGLGYEFSDVTVTPYGETTYDGDDLAYKYTISMTQSNRKSLIYVSVAQTVSGYKSGSGLNFANVVAQQFTISDSASLGLVTDSTTDFSVSDKKLLIDVYQGGSSYYFKVKDIKINIVQAILS